MNAYSRLVAFFRGLCMPVGQDGNKQVKVQLLAVYALSCVYMFLTFLWLEGGCFQWFGSLDDRLCYFTYQFTIMGLWRKTLVLRMRGIRSSPTLILALFKPPMATLDRQEQMPNSVPACEWCRMGLHKKCDRINKLHAICVCDCERGY